MSSSIKFASLLSLIALTACGGGTPSKEEVQNLIIQEGLPYAEQQVRYVPWDHMYRVSLSAGNQHASDVIGKAQSQLDNVKVNDNALKKYLKNDMTVENVKCEESTEFKKFYNCSVSIRYNTEKYYYLKTYDIMLNRLDDNSLVVSNTDIFSLQNIGYGNFGENIYHDLPKNLFTTLKSSQYAPSTDAQSIYIPKNDDVIIDRNFYSELRHNAYKK